MPTPPGFPRLLVHAERRGAFHSRAMGLILMKMDRASAEVTRLLQEWSNGQEQALDRLVPQIHRELRKLAASYLRKERPDHTLQPTALVNEAFLKLIDQRAVKWQNRAHFFGIAAQAMRRILVDHARAHAAGKRGDGVRKVPLDDAMMIGGTVGYRSARARRGADAAGSHRSPAEPRRRAALFRRPDDGRNGRGDAHLAGDRRPRVEDGQSLVVRRDWPHRLSNPTP